jgi:HEAT repeat protein
VASSLPARALLLVFILVLPPGVSTRADEQPVPEEQAWAVVHAGLTETKVAYRVSAIEALSLMSEDQRAINFALRALEDRDEHVRVAAAVTLGQLHAERAVPQLKKALKDRRMSVVLAAARSLLLLKDPSAYAIYYAILMRDKKTNDGLIEGQLKRFRDPKQVAQLGFQEGLGFVPLGGVGYEAVRELRKHNTAPVRAAAARWLASDPDKMTEDALIQTALVDKSLIVRLASLDALAERGDPSSIGRLQKNLSDRNSAVRYRTAALILRLSAKTRTRNRQ